VPNGRCLPRSLSEYSGPSASQEGGGFISPPGKFVRLSHGEVHYLLEGSSSRPLVVIVHGLHESVLMYDELRRELLAANYRVLIYDCYGNGWTQAPTATYDEHLYVGQLAELLFALDMGQTKFHLMGHSLGGGIVASFATVYPQRLLSLTLSAPTGIDVTPPPEARISAYPIMGPIIGTFFATSAILRKQREHYPFPKHAKRMELSLMHHRYQMEHNPDLLQASRDIFANFNLYDFASEYKFIGAQSFPVKAIIGDLDILCPVKGVETLKKWVPRLNSTILPGLGHSAYFQEPELYNKVVVDFIRSATSN